MKTTIDSIFDDGLNIFAGNTFLINDDRFADIMANANDLDLILSEEYGARELLRRMIKNDDTHGYIYDMSKINRHVYATMISNLPKYTILLNSLDYVDEEPTNEYGETYVKGQNIKTHAYGNRVDTTEYGAIHSSNTTGQSTDSTTNGERITTDAVTSFSSSDFNNTDKTTNSSVIDSTTYGSRTDTSDTTHGADTKRYNAHTDTLTDDETTDTKTGYRDLYGNIEKRKRVFDKSVVGMIANEVVNSITYSMYL